MKGNGKWRIQNSETGDACSPSYVQFVSHPLQSAVGSIGFVLCGGSAFLGSKTRFFGFVSQNTFAALPPGNGGECGMLNWECGNKAFRRVAHRRHRSGGWGGRGLAVKGAEIAKGFPNSGRCRSDKAGAAVAQPDEVGSGVSWASFAAGRLPILSIRPKFGSVWKNVR